LTFNWGREAMTAGTFGRKGVVGAPAQRRAGLVAHQPRSFQPAMRERPPGDDVESRRAAFLAAEHARKEERADAESLFSRWKPAPRVVGPRSLMVAYLLWIFLGSLGAHRFYLGRTMSGAVLACLTFASWALVTGQTYEAFAGVLVSSLWVFADAFLIKSMHRAATGGALAPSSPPPEQ
jgi:TM2 domain-containing membrane protein YozV